MKLSIDYNTARYTINAYDNGIVRINGEDYHNSLVITPEDLVTEWEPGHMGELEETHFDVMIERRPEIIVLGTGNNLTFPPPRMLAYVMQHGIGLEVMDTGSACRTYNVLSSEDRDVIAALMI